GLTATPCCGDRDCDTPCTIGICDNGGSENGQCFGTCRNVPLPNGSECSTGNSDETGTCRSGECIGTPLDCDDHNPCTADTATGGVCVHTSTGCDDGNPCNGGETCEACVFCEWLQYNECCEHEPRPECRHDPRNPPPEPGTPCDDHDACTEEDRCNGQECHGVPMICPLPDQCHEEGRCDPQTGACTPPTKPD